MILWFYKRAGSQHSLLATGPAKQRTGKRNRGEDSYSLAKHVLPHSLVQPPGTYSLCRAFCAEGLCVEHHHKHLPLAAQHGPASLSTSLYIPSSPTSCWHGDLEKRDLLAAGGAGSPQEADPQEWCILSPHMLYVS